MSRLQSACFPEGLTLTVDPSAKASSVTDPAQTVDDLGRNVATCGGRMSAPPERIGRYRIERLLGKGGFGLVYLSYDDQLQRFVAIKAPHSHLVEQPADAEAYLFEARTVAGLDHANIVPVYDVGCDEVYPCFIVSKFIDGTNLFARLKQSRASIQETVELTATVAQALNYAHEQGLVHRDVKPGNILVDKSGKPFIVDFGLALREQDIGTGLRYAGTPAYMSPEQAGGEGHRVDGRSDVFSLGVVLYEMLTGRRPFRGDTHREVLAQVASHEPRPPRQFDDAIPRELERICLKALSKRARERYATAGDMADDLQCLILAKAEDSPSVTIDAPFGPGSVVSGASAVFSEMITTPGVGGSQHLWVVPKGLRSFDEHDADFFLELLPGPRDRDDLPDSIRFWKTNIEEMDSDKTFSVGLIYGPSGCGKSSLVRAGLLPRLSSDVVAVYVEAAAEETEARLLRGLRKGCPGLSADLGLKESLTALRLGHGVAVGKKTLIIIDQFEQWLHAKRDGSDKELIQALRQCDGGRVQCIVMVRDDFWLALSRFLRDLEIQLVEGRNSALTDLFDADHARKVLAAFGRAFGRLPENARAMEKEHKEFLKQAVAGLAQEGKVISVRLALFAEMMKGKPWTPAALREVGGAKGVGVTFLEETFSADTAPPRHRYHQKAARAILKTLLPEAGTDIKGNMRSRRDLLEASGYADRPRDFDELIQILDGEIRLITPTEPERKDEAAQSDDPTGAEYYQLTHDYLVPSLRDWLTRKQRESMPGRAELLLADRSGIWNTRRENRQLPSLPQWLQIRCLTAKRDWTRPQRMMMAKAGRYHALRTLAAAFTFALLGWAGYEAYGRFQARALTARLLDANTDEVPTILKDMVGYRRRLDPLLREALAQAEASKDDRKRLHAGLALLPFDNTQVDYLYNRLLDADPHDIPVIRDALAPHKNALKERLWAVVESSSKEKAKQRLQAASALASYDAPNPRSEPGRWRDASRLIVDEVLGAVERNPSRFATLLVQFRPVGSLLAQPLAEVYRSRDRRDSERVFATSILADYAANDPHLLADLLMDADEKQFPLLFPKLKPHGASVLAILRGELGKRRDAISDARDKEKQARRQANAAVAIWRLEGAASVLSLLEHGEDPTLRSYLVRRLGPMGAVDVQDIMALASAEPNVSIRRALVLSLGEFADAPPAERAAAADWLAALYERDADPGMHAAAEFALGALGERKRIDSVLERLSKTEERVQQECAIRAGGAPLWYVNGQGQTMVVIRGPVEFVMGSPASEIGREDTETQHEVKISRTFAIAAKTVSVDEFRRLQSERLPSGVANLSPRDPQTWVSWLDAAKYCNRLSRQEGIPPDQWCYEVDASDNVIALRENSLNLSGYRLPTEAELEFATRASAGTIRFFGDSEELLSGYGWYVPNSNGTLRPAGLLRPNDLGLFDVHGDVWCWCHGKRRDYPRTERGRAIEDVDTDPEVGAHPRMLRGGCYTDHATGVRSAHRWAKQPMSGSNIIGFRVARTIVPGR